ncbi:MAG TPA: tetratricopeptide repeat protein, partial [Gemmatimonadaceae bacterium]|nr:tetratricopeptide repeat protein [Gemmatimonadaceae bacterium]
MRFRSIARSLVMSVGIAMPLIVAGAQVARPAERDTPAALYQRGAHAEAIAAAGAGANGAAGSAGDAIVLVRAMTDIGQPAQAVTRVGAWRTNADVAPAIAAAFEAMGELDSADASWLVAARGPDSLRARVERLRLQRTRGAGDSVTNRLAAILMAGQSRGPRSASDAHALAIAARLLGRTDPQRFKEALALYDRALRLEPTRLDARVELGEMFLEKFNFADARSTLQQVLSVNPRQVRALAAMVRLNASEGRGRSVDALPALLAVNPASADGHALAARRLVDAEQHDSAVVEARRGLVTDSAAPGPWIAIAAARWLANDTIGHAAALDRAHRRLPASAQAEVELAEVAARNRLYADAVRFAREGVARDPRDARAQALLGINLLRVGQIVTGRQTLEGAFALDPYDVWAKNTLDLLDAYASARTTATDHFDIVVEQDDADLLSLYAAPLAEQAFDSLTVRYGFTPTDRVRVEFFRSHADFSVRAVGLAGLGALGVAFGNVLAIDAPPARPRGEFNWRAVLWHEFAHTITLGATANRVPRWVSEGLSVHEERRARREWGGGVTPTLIAAYGAGRLQPVSRLNDGFVHPRYDEEVILSYALAAYVFEMLEERKGVQGLRDLLSGYRRGVRTPLLMQQVYGLQAAALDSTFDRWFRTKFAREFTSVRGTMRAGDGGEPRLEITGPLREAMAAATMAARQKNWPQVVTAAMTAVRLFPESAERGSAYHLLAEAHTAMNDTVRTIAALREITLRNGDAVDENILLGRLLEARRDTAGAVAAYDRATRIYPFDAATQARLGELAYSTRTWSTSIRARRAVLALGPADRADALYRLAQSLAGAG